MATLKQKLVVQKLSEIIRNNTKSHGINMYKILKEAGYSESVAKKPQLVLKRKGIQSVIGSEEERVFKMMIEALESLLRTGKVKKWPYSYPKEMSDEEIIIDIEEFNENPTGYKCKSIKTIKNKKIAYVFFPDRNTQLRTLDIILKLKGYYDTDPKEEMKQEKYEMQAEYEALSDKEVYLRIRELEKLTFPNRPICPSCKQTIR